MPLNRRQFLTASLASLTLLSSLSPTMLAANSPIIKPRKLKPGSGVGLVSPAGTTFIKQDIDIVQDAVKSLGLVPYLAPHLLDQYGYLAGKDQDRAADINQFFTDPKIDILLPIRGGWGCARMLPYLDFNLIKNNPKIIIGFSDLTALLIAIYAKTGLVTFHGPNGFTSWRPDQVNSFKETLFLGEKVTFKNQPDGEDSDRLMQVKNRIQTITPGTANGKLIGGNLSVLSGIIGSQYVPSFKGHILFVEDVGENIYRIDRLLTHLKIAGVLDSLSGFIFGQCVNCSPDGDYASLTLEQVLNDHIKPLGIPAWSGAQIGHIEPVLTFPMGIEVEINSNTGTINYLESGVI
ncbi:LD-carboxypeptidase [Crocosphaera sp. UHCC 0190]|uniref:S66 peptidase family protein n=1 Tax=Crocosphaera sp. UHCC 0190 TaxID=3110246 RepID=UPI002B2056F7|nr:LD-carboxypeptidase [Crocosphaera sp. UHCC 0190]MEA5508481.1 LD-carboxypeptidase [Crocosphaera sp. UHCC 0190]